MAGSSQVIQVRTNWVEVYKYLDRAARKQVPFAAALALTRVAQLGQLRVRSRLPSKFHLRSGWVAGGIRVVPARKSDWPHQYSAVGSRDDFMLMQETGGTKRPRSAPALAIPGVRQPRGAGGRMPKGQRPAALLKRRGYFTQRLTSGRNKGQMALLQRTSGERYPLRVVYLFEPKAQIRPAFRFREDVEDSASRQYAAVFGRVLNQALATAIPKGGASSARK
jgi:hypothetical protein